MSEGQARPQGSSRQPYSSAQARYCWAEARCQAGPWAHTVPRREQGFRNVMEAVGADHQS